MCRMQPEQEPDDRSVGVLVPGDPQRWKFPDAHDQRKNSNDRHDDHADADFREILTAGPNFDQMVGHDARHQHDQYCGARQQIWRRRSDRPMPSQHSQVEISADRQGKASCLKGDEGNGSPPHRACRSEIIGGQVADVGDWAVSHSSSSGSPFGQNQPMKPIETGTAPQTTAQGVYIEPRNAPPTAMADSNGQIELSADGTLSCGTASVTVLPSTSRASTRRPSTTGSMSGSA